MYIQPMPLAPRDHGPAHTCRMSAYWPRPCAATTFPLPTPVIGRHFSSVIPGSNFPDSLHIDDRGASVDTKEVANVVVCSFLPARRVVIDACLYSSTLKDQLLLYGPEPSSLDDILASLEASAHTPGLSVLWLYMSQCTFPIDQILRAQLATDLFHIPCIARQLSETINGGALSFPA